MDNNSNDNNNSSNNSDKMNNNSNNSASRFTEAVPLSLSSLAHLTVPLEDGVMDGIRELVQHVQMAAINYARKTSVHPHALKELWADDWMWSKEASSHLPPALAKLGFQHSYQQQVHLCLGQPSADSKGKTATTGTAADDWTNDPTVLACISFHYASEELFTDEELNEPPDDDDDFEDNAMKDDTDDDDDDIPIAILYQVNFSYRSIPPPSDKNVIAKEAEELSFLTFGGSVDDSLKYGALAALHDVHAKYILNVQSVRGKKYRLDVMDATLADGRLPRWKLDDTPFSRTLCVTVTDSAVATPTTNNTAHHTMTRLSLTLDGALRQPKECHPKLHHYTKALEKSFLLWRKPVSIMAHPSNQSLLLNANLAGQVYIDGKYHTTWGKDCKIGTFSIALFGLDLAQIPVWHGRIVDYDTLKQVYATAWQEVMIDARLMGLGLNKMLLYRLLYGKDETEVYDDDDDAVDTSMETLESLVMACPKYDPVGICSKALATTFRMEFGLNAFPCLACDTKSVQLQLGHLVPIVVPARLISVLRRGGYFDIAHTITEVWFTESVRPASSDEEKSLIADACRLLQNAGVDGILPQKVLLTRLDFFPDDPLPLKHNNIVRYQAELQQYYVNEAALKELKNPFYLALELCKHYPEEGMLMERKLLEYKLSGGGGGGTSTTATTTTGAME